MKENFSGVILFGNFKTVSSKNLNQLKKIPSIKRMYVSNKNETYMTLIHQIFNLRFT